MNPESKLPLEDFRNQNLLHRKNLSLFCDILKKSLYPEGVIHPIFPSLIKKLTDSKDKETFTIACFWKEMDSCFVSTHERKFMCFQILQLMLPTISHAHVPFILTPNFLKCYINTLSNKKSLLYAQAINVTKALISASKDPKVGLGIVSVLIDKKLMNFDSLTKTKTVEGIITNLDISAIEEYVVQLISMSTNDSNESLKKWTAEQLSLLIRNGSILKDEGYVSQIVEHFLLQGFFDQEMIPSTSMFFREKLFSILGHLSTVSLKNSKAPKDATKEDLRKHALEARKTRGMLENGSTWFAFVLQKLLNIKEQKKLCVSIDDSAASIITDVANVLNMLEKASNNNMTEINAMGSLLSYILLEMHHDPSNTASVAQDLKEVTTRLFLSDKKKSKKRKYSSEEDPDAYEVLVDILLSLLSRDSAVVRHISTEVFKAFLNKINQNGLDLCFEILNAGDGAVGHEELFEEKEGNENLSDDDDESDLETINENMADVDVERENNTLREKIMNAMKNENMTKETMKENSDDEIELPDLNDDEMTAFDAHLTNIFAQKKAISKDRKQAKLTVLHFKLRVLEILDEFLKNGRHVVYITQKLLPLYGSLSSSKDNMSIHTKIGSIFTKLSKIKTDLEIETEGSLDLLKTIHSKFKKCSLTMAQVYSSLSIFICRYLLTGSNKDEVKILKNNISLNPEY